MSMFDFLRTRSELKRKIERLEASLALADIERGKLKDELRYELNESGRKELMPSYPFLDLPDLAKEVSAVTEQKVDAIRYGPFGYEYGIETRWGISWFGICQAPSSVEKYLRAIGKPAEYIL